MGKIDSIDDTDSKAIVEIINGLNDDESRYVILIVTQWNMKNKLYITGDEYDTWINSLKTAQQLGIEINKSGRTQGFDAIAGGVIIMTQGVGNLFSGETIPTVIQYGILSIDCGKYQGSFFTIRYFTADQYLANQLGIVLRISLSDVNRLLALMQG